MADNVATTTRHSAYTWYGANVNNLVSKFLKIWIVSEEGVCVVGMIGEGTTKELVSNWEAPFEDMALGSVFQTAGGVIQVLTGKTTKNILNSRQVWAGNEPYTFSLVMKFAATSDPYHEVTRPILELEKMMAPDLGGVGSVGKVPRPVQICVGNRHIMNDCIIKSMSEPMDKERNEKGDLIRADVALQVETLTIVTKEDMVQSIQSKVY